MSRYRYVATIRRQRGTGPAATATAMRVKIPFTTTATKSGTVHQNAIEAAEKQGWTDFTIESVVPDGSKP